MFDKTGTLTLGRPGVVGLRPAVGVSIEDLLATAATLERGSSHPLASAIVRECETLGTPTHRASKSVAERGRGLRALVAGRQTLVGTRAFLEANGVSNAVIDALGSLTRTDATLVYVARDAMLLGVIELADQMRAEAAPALEQLSALHVEYQLVSGDLPGAVEALAVRLGIVQWIAQANPERKAEIVRALRNDGRCVAFVGDGINDAPALASADVGLAMGGGSEIAMETAQAAIISNDPSAVARAIQLSRDTMRTIVQNLFWAFAYNVVLIPLAAFGLVQPTMAAGAMGLSSLFVVGNSLLLRRRN